LNRIRIRTRRALGGVNPADVDVEAPDG